MQPRRRWSVGRGKLACGDLASGGEDTGATSTHWRTTLRIKTDDKGNTGSTTSAQANGGAKLTGDAVFR